MFVSLKRSELPTFVDALFLDTLLRESCVAAGKGADLPDWRAYPLGSSTNARVTAIKDYGVVMLAPDGKTVLLAPSPSHVADCKVNDEVKVRVLDVDWAKRLLTVTLLPDLVKEGRSKRRKSLAASAPKEGEDVSAKVLFKANRYAIVSVDGILAVLGVADYQCPYLSTKTLEVGATVEGVVRRNWRPLLEGAEATQSPHEPLMLLTPQGEGSADGQATRKKKDKNPDRSHVNRLARSAPQVTSEELIPGSKLQGVVSAVEDDEVTLLFNLEDRQGGEGEAEGPGRVVAKVYVTHGPNLDPAALSALGKRKGKGKKGKEEGDEARPSFHPFHGLEVGQVVSVRVLEVRSRGRGRHRVRLVECSLRPGDLSAENAEAVVARQPTWANLAMGQAHLGVVSEVHASGVWVALSRMVKGFVHCLDAGEAFAKLVEHKAVGLPLVVAVAEIEADKHRMQLSMRGAPKDVRAEDLPIMTGFEGTGGARLLPSPGDVVVGQVSVPFSETGQRGCSGIQKWVRKDQAKCLCQVKALSDWGVTEHELLD